MEDKTDINQGSEKQFSVDVKPLTQYDKFQYPALLDEVMRVEVEAWPKEWRATRDKFQSRLEVFPEGFFVAFSNGKMAGVSTSEITNYDPENLPTTWDKITDNGYIRKTHNLAGNALYVVSVGVSANFQGQGIGRNLMEAQIQLTKGLGLKYLFLGARIPKFGQYHKEHVEVTAERYVTLEKAPRRKLDPEIRFYESCGLKIVKVIPNYGPDPDSENFGVVMVWENPGFGK